MCKLVAVVTCHYFVPELSGIVLPFTSMMKAERSVESPAAGSKKGAFMRSGWCKNTGELILFLAKKWILDVLTQKYGSPLHFRQKKNKSTLNNARGGGWGRLGRPECIGYAEQHSDVCHWGSALGANAVGSSQWDVLGS